MHGKEVHVLLRPAGNIREHPLETSDVVTDDGLLRLVLLQEAVGHNVGYVVADDADRNIPLVDTCQLVGGKLKRGVAEEHLLDPCYEP